MVIYGIQDTMKLVESGAVGKLICYEGLDYLRIKLRNTETQSVSVIYVKPELANNPALYQ